LVRELDMKKGIKLERSEKTVAIIAYAVLGVFTILAILPVLHVASKGVSSGEYVSAGSVLFWPRGFQLETLRFILAKTNFLKALSNSLLILGVGTLVSMTTTILTAWPLSKTGFRGRKPILFLFVFSMIFYGGMIPAYMVVRTLGLIDSIWACILPFAIVQFNMFIVKNYFEALPQEIEESAKMDGAGEVRTLVSIICPMSTPVIATVGLLYAINYWNNYFHAMMYTTSESMRTLQVYLYNLIGTSSEVALNLASGSSMTNLTSSGLVAAAVFLSVIPILLLYPFVQRFLVQGMTVGSVKG
jgi:putative aldouronate transport system permease protein